MAGFGLGNYINPAVGGFIDQRRNALAGLGAGLLQGRPGAGVQEGIQADTAFAVMQKAEEERLKSINQTQAWLQQNYPQYANLPPEQGWQAAMGDMAAARSASGPSMTSDIQNYEYGLANPGFIDFQTQKGGASEVSLTPTWGIDTDPQSPTFNKPILGQLNKAGQFVKTELPTGVQPMNPIDLAGGKQGAIVDAKTQAGARAALPGAQQAVAIAKNAINLVRNDEAGLNEQFGNTGFIPNRNLPTVPGVFQQAKGNWQANFSQAKGQAFMQAREMLKGGGPITDYEGMKGEAAFSRMEQAVATGDKATFLRALDDFEAAVEDGYAKLVATANGEYAAGTPAVTGGNGMNTTATGIQWSVGP